MKIYQNPWKVNCAMIFAFWFALPVIHSNELAENYINNFKDIAISEMYRTGIPASIKLAQGLLESSWGRSTLSREANNHFGIKCGTDWDGRKIFLEDDDYNIKGDLIKSCFRVYKSVQESYIAHSEFLVDPRKQQRYGFLFSIPVDDYKSWAKGLYEAGYATDSKYAWKLIQIIEQYRLFELDQGGALAFETRREDELPESIEKDNVSPNTEHSTTNRKYVNGLLVIYPEEGESLGDFADRTNLSLETIKKYNEKIGNRSTVLDAQIPVFLSPKKEKYSGNKEEHRVRRGESMFGISQKYGVRLENLYAFNRMPGNSEPLPGEVILLNSYAHLGKRPRFFEKTDNANTSGEELLFEDIDFEGKHSEKTK